MLKIQRVNISLIPPSTAKNGYSNKKIFLKYDITPRQFIVLQTIDFQPGSNQNEIVESINKIGQHSVRS
ncbi:MAG: hypothetical protein CM15mP111_0700 [Hyphomicrobiales bacterium]|nr:MAG: hypothetical protein CM15mP111_0700 [Hyphomicrobiales bacterium]